MYYDYSKIMGYKAFLNLIIKERGYGGTLGAKKIVINDFLKNKSQFIWLRLSDVDCEKVTQNRGVKFFSDLPDIGINLSGKIQDNDDDNSNKISGSTIFINGETAGYVIPLYAYDQLKGDTYNKVKWIIFDEFIPSKHKRVLYNVNDAFANMVETIARTRENVRIIAIANSINKNHPLLYKLGFKINEHGFYTIKHNNKNFAVLHFAKSGDDYKNLHANSNAGILANLLGQDKVILNNEFENLDIIIKNGPLKYKLQFILHNGGMPIKFNITKNGDYYLQIDNNNNTNVNYRYCYNTNYLEPNIKYEKGLKILVTEILQNKKTIYENEYIYSHLVNSL